MVPSLLASFVTVLTGAIVLAFWADTQRAEGDRRSFVLGILHVTVAVTAVVLWTIFVVSKRTAVGRASVGLIGAAAVAGMAALWSSRHGERTHKDIEAVPLAVLALHALAAAGTLAGAVVALESR